MCEANDYGKKSIEVNNSSLSLCEIIVFVIVVVGILVYPVAILTSLGYSWAESVGLAAMVGCACLVGINAAIKGLAFLMLKAPWLGYAVVLCTGVLLVLMLGFGVGC